MEMLIEEGQALRELVTPRVRSDVEQMDVIVIGGGQQGLATGYHLKRLGLRFAILDAGERVGDVWRHRWDSLRLFTPAAYDGLPGMRYPASPGYFPTKDEFADYLERYAGHFALPVRLRTRVERLTREGDRYRVLAGGRWLEARHVVVAMGLFQQPSLPAFARELDPAIVQLHSSEYLRPSQVPEGDVLLVGAANSGAEIARDLAGAGRRIYLAGRDVGDLPFRMGSFLGRNVLCHAVLGFAFNRVLTVDTKRGREVRDAEVGHGHPLIRVRSKDLANLGVERVGRVEGARDGRPLLADGRCLDVKTVIWCNGFHGGWSWIELPIFDAHGLPRHDRGVVEGEPGLYFAGLPFQSAMASVMIQGTRRDPAHVTARIAERQAAQGVPARL